MKGIRSKLDFGPKKALIPLFLAFFGTFWRFFGTIYFCMQNDARIMKKAIKFL